MKICLWNGAVPYAAEGADTPNSMETYLLPTDRPLPCVVVLPGGAYAAASRKHLTYLRWFCHRPHR